MADVEIMLEQCKMIFYKSEDKINDYKNKKIKRLERRLMS